MVEIRVDNEITLRTVVLSDALPVFELIDANRERFRWLPRMIEMKTVEDERRWIEEALTLDDGSSGFLIMVDNDIAGGVGHGPVEQNGDVNVGYWLAAEYEGRGIVTRSCAVVVDQLFEREVGRRAMIRAGRDNVRSRAVAERLGFTLDENEHETMELEDGPTEMVAYAMRAADWPGPEQFARRRKP